MGPKTVLRLEYDRWDAALSERKRGRKSDNSAADDDCLVRLPVHSRSRLRIERKPADHARAFRVASYGCRGEVTSSDALRPGILRKSPGYFTASGSGTTGSEGMAGARCSSSPPTSPLPTDVRHTSHGAVPFEYSSSKCCLSLNVSIDAVKPS